VWLGEHRSSHKRYAIKQILSKNTHQSHLKEISFGTHFFDGGEIKKQFLSFPGHKNLVKFLAYELKPLDTWIFFELCGESLGNHLYDLKGESHGSERHYRVYKIIFTIRCGIKNSTRCLRKITMSSRSSFAN
jgi:dual specificity tyrosine-phosphorylation-regulated kinase 2/3/4